MKALAIAVAALVAAAALPADAATILTFGQSGGGNPITATAIPTGTTWGNNDIMVTITQIDGAVSTPTAAFLDITATSTADGATTAGPAIVEHFNGSFSITSGAGDTGTNYLSGSFADAAITAEGATAIAVFGPTASFTSDVITTLDLPRSVSFALTDVTDPVSLVAAPGTVSGETIASFTSSIAGNASAFGVPEPASIGLLGVGLVGLGYLARRKHRGSQP